MYPSACSVVGCSSGVHLCSEVHSLLRAEVRPWCSWLLIGTPGGGRGHFISLGHAQPKTIKKKPRSSCATMPNLLELAPLEKSIINAPTKKKHFQNRNNFTNFIFALKARQNKMLRELKSFRQMYLMHCTQKADTVAEQKRMLTLHPKQRAVMTNRARPAHGPGGSTTTLAATVDKMRNLPSNDLFCPPKKLIPQQARPTQARQPATTLLSTSLAKNHPG